MPDLNGAKLLEALKADPNTRDIPIVIHTARNLTPGERAHLEKHSLAILNKNHTDRHASLRFIQEILGRSQGAPQASEPTHDAKP